MPDTTDKRTHWHIYLSVQMESDIKSIRFPSSKFVQSVITKLRSRRELNPRPCGHWSPARHYFKRSVTDSPW